MQDSPQVLCIYLSYGPAFREPGLKILRRQCARLFPNKKAHFVCVENAWQGDIELKLSPDTILISGDNRVREFTGYEKGVSWVGDSLSVSSDTPVVIANDTFYRNYGARYLDGFSAEVVSESLRTPSLMGHIDRFPSPVEADGWIIERWIRTSFFITSWQTLKSLLPLSFPFSSEAIFGKPGSEFFLPEAPLDSRYRDYLRTWLFGESRRDEFAHRWHSAAPLDEQNRKAMQEKALCILSEHRISSRAEKLGIRLVATHTPSIENTLKQGLRKLARLGEAFTQRLVDTTR